MRRVCLVPLICMLACGESEAPTGLDVPAFETSHVVYGTAAAGRALPPSSLRIVPTDTLTTLVPELISGTDIDMYVAGLDETDLPEGITPQTLRFVAAREARARRLPTFTQPHVLLAPSPPETPERLVPVEGADVRRKEREERLTRVAALLDDLAVQSPCVDPTTPIRVTTPRTSAESVRVLHTYPSEDTLVGFAVTSTVVFGWLRRGSDEVRIEPVPTANPLLMEGEVGELQWVSSTAFERDGRPWPTAFAIDITDGLASSGALLVWSEARARYVEDTPVTETDAPRHLEGMQSLSLDGEAQRCAFGTALGAERTASMWCRTETSTTWRTVLRVPRALGVSGLRVADDEGHLAADLAGTVYTYGGRDRWTPLLQSSVNSGCDPLCAAFSSFLGIDSGAPLGVIAGAKAQFLLLESVQGQITTRRPEALDAALFGDERPDAEAPLRFSALARAPDGAIWFADVTPELFRLDPGSGQVQRICLPIETRGVPIAAIEPHPDGRLVLGMSPALIGIGDWRQ